MEPVNFSTSKFCKERKREREGERKSPEQKGEEFGAERESGIDRSGFFFRSSFRSPWALGSSGGGSLLPRPGQTLGEVGGRAGVEKPARAAAAAAGGPRVRSLFHPGDLCSRPLPHPGLSLLLPPPRPPHPTPPPPGPLPRAPRHPRALAHAPSRAHTWSARGKVSPAIAAREPCGGAPGCNLELSQCGDTFSLLLLPPSFLRPPPRLFFFFKKSISPPTTTPIQPAPILRAPPSS